MQVGDAVKLSLEGLVHVTEVLEYYNLGWDSVGLVVKKYECQSHVFEDPQSCYDIYIAGHTITMLSKDQIEKI